MKRLCPICGAGRQNAPHRVLIRYGCGTAELNGSLSQSDACRLRKHNQDHGGKPPRGPRKSRRKP